VVPDFAEVFYYLRHPDAQILQDMWGRLEQAALGAAQGTGTQVDWEIIHGNHPLLVNETLARMLDTHLRQVGGVDYDASELAFAEQLYSTLDQPQRRIGDQLKIEPYTVSLGYGSTDVGDVSIAVPTAGIDVATWVPGTAPHSWQAVAAGGMSIGHKGALNAARVLTLAAVELMQNSALIEAAQREHRQKLGDDFRYVPLLGDRDPPLDYRN
jgi:aminobenzoyl-glutamate utilization protein B